MIWLAAAGEAVKRIPWQAWAALLVAALLAGVWLHGRSSGKAACEARYARAEAKADAKGERVAKRAPGEAREARDTIRKESDDAQADVRTIIRTLPATCPAQPDRVREFGDAAVQRARDSVLPAEGR